MAALADYDFWRCISPGAGDVAVIEQATAAFGSIDPATRPPWGAFLDETTLAGNQGGVHCELALAKRDPQAAGRAVPLLRHAVDQIGPPLRPAPGA